MELPPSTCLIVAALLAFGASSGCAPANDRRIDAGSARSDTAPPPRGQMAVPEGLDTAIIRTAGVPTDPDDTIGTQFQKHEAPRWVPAPACLPTGFALCFVDTARLVRSTDVEEGGVPDMRQTPWVVFAAPGDSIQVFLIPSRGSYITMAPRSASGFGAEHALGVDASWIRPRFPDSGPYVFTASIESDSAIPYELRVVPVIATAATRPIGASAALTLAGDSSMRVGLVPATMARSLDGPRVERFALRAGHYRVLLVRDTAYIACRLPCNTRQRFTMRAGQEVTIAP